MAYSFGSFSMLVSLAILFIPIRVRQMLTNRALTEVAIDLASSKAKDIHKKLDSLYDKTSNSRMKDRYNSCSKNYHDAMRDLEETKRLFNDHDYKRILVQVNDVVEEVHDCKNQLDKLEKKRV
ncbi:hypothetical protein Acr_25g0010370 [Actinidia rufa]|uniref:Pectinesterase inhibitor domain-containing protein n=1 Tax=Actinidia rufa TaxID=165716 RepID=A0A7J0H0V1_9ERIC|nr:hypothetical protein Acr_25g0010370 [Actinidia rufa]